MNLGPGETAVILLIMAVVYFTVIRRTDSSESMAPPGWYADPSGQHPTRYWNGMSWTDQTANGDVTCSSISNR